VNKVNENKRIDTSPDKINRTVRKRPTDEHQPDLSKRLREQDESAYIELLNLYSKKVFRLAMSLVKHKEDAEDVTQEVFLTVCSRIDDLKESKALSSWIYRITVNASLMKIRKSGRSEQVSFEEDLPRFDQNGMHVKPVKDWSENPEEKASSKEVMDFIRENLKELPESYKVVFLLRDVEGLSNNEVAEVLDISLTATKSRLHRARLFMRERLSKYFEGSIA
jgi:RNA polymerase sigma-70 factor (ECF subfamily)